MSACCPAARASLQGWPASTSAFASWARRGSAHFLCCRLPVVWAGLPAERPRKLPFRELGKRLRKLPFRELEC